jgi:hypothetical protein
LVRVLKEIKYFGVSSTLKGIVSSFEFSANAEYKWQVIPLVPAWLYTFENRLTTIVLEQALASEKL